MDYILKILKMRQEAKRIQTKEDIKYSEALDIVAKRNKESSWRDFIKKIRKKNTNNILNLK